MFVQIIEGRTSDPAALRDHGEQWQVDVGPSAVGFLGVTAGTTADGRTITLARFEDEASARANSELPQQHAWWEGMAKLYDGDVTFTESSDVTELLRGGSNDAGFVQIMRSTGVDRADVERLDAELSRFAAQRPDIIGGYRVWTGPDACVEAIYFTSEAEARRGEKSPMPEELQALIDSASQGEIEFLDLTDPMIR